MPKKTLEFRRQTLSFPGSGPKATPSVSPQKLDPKTGQYYKTPIAKAMAKKLA